MKEPSFERCIHDKKNPYVMISREMAQDKSISPKAKGVLLYILSLPPDWKIYHSQLQKGMNVGEEYLNSALEELIVNGYADRTRERVNGMYQPYKYIIREFKKSLPNGENQPGSSGPENPGLHNIDIESIEKQQHSAAVSSVSKEKSVLKYQTFEVPIPTITIHPELEKTDIPESDKIEISRRYSRDIVKNAIDWATHPETKINKTLVQAIKWACHNKPEVPKSKEDVSSKNRQYAKKFDGLRNGIAQVTALNASIEVSFLSSQKTPIEISYSENGFKEQLESLLRKCRLI